MAASTGGKPVRNVQKSLAVSAVGVVYVCSLASAARFKDFAIRPTLQKLCLEHSIHTQFSFSFFANFSERSFLHFSWKSESVEASSTVEQATLFLKTAKHRMNAVCGTV